MLGTIVNTGAVILGGLLGLLLKKGLSEKMADTLMKGLGLCTLFLGISGSCDCQPFILRRCHGDCWFPAKWFAGNQEMLFNKSMLDFVAAIIFASSLGVGVIFSAALVVIYQGAITLLAQWIAPFLTDTVSNEMT